MNKTNNKVGKTVRVMIGFSAFAFLFHLIYAHFSHGIDSVAMKTMYLSILIFGALFYGLLGAIIQGVTTARGYRLFVNLYNTGLSAVVIGQLLQGIVEIAGTGSDYIMYYYAFGVAMMLLGIVILGVDFYKDNRKTQKITN